MRRIASLVSIKPTSLMLNAYAFALVAYLLLRRAVGDGFWPIFMAEYAMPLAALPAVALIPTCLRRHQWLASAAMCVGLVTLVGPYFGHQSPRGGAVTTATLRVAVCNVGNGRASPSLLVQMLRDSGADVVGLVEVTQSEREAVRAGLRELYPYQVHMESGKSEKSILSKYPITAWQVLGLSPGRPDLAAQVQVSGRSMRVIVAHPPPPRVQAMSVRLTDAAQVQFADLLKTAATGWPTVLIGDLNITPQHQLYERLRAAGLVDSFEESGTGDGFTFARRIGSLSLPPVLRIDYVWHSPELRAVGAWVGPDVGSDHLPVVADLTWADGQGTVPNGDQP